MIALISTDDDEIRYVWEPDDLVIEAEAAIAAASQDRQLAIRGLSDESLASYEVILEQATVAALEWVCDRVARSLAEPVVAGGVATGQDTLDAVMHESGPDAARP